MIMNGSSPAANNGRSTTSLSSPRELGEAMAFDAFISDLSKDKTTADADMARA